MQAVDVFCVRQRQKPRLPYRRIIECANEYFLPLASALNGINRVADLAVQRALFAFCKQDGMGLTDFIQSFDPHEQRGLRIECRHHLSIDIVHELIGIPPVGAHCLLCSIIEDRDPADTVQKSQRHAQLIVVVAGIAQKTLAVMVVEKCQQTVRGAIFAVLIENLLYLASVCILIKHVMHSKMQGIIKHTPNCPLIRGIGRNKPGIGLSKARLPNMLFKGRKVSFRNLHHGI